MTLAVCTAVLILEMYENGREAAAHDAADGDCEYKLEMGSVALCAATLAINPMFGPTTAVLLRMGASQGVLTITRREVWRLIAPLYLHGGLVHYGINMLVLFQLGGQLERLHGCLRVGAIYLFSGMFGTLMGAALSPHTVAVGASGAIFGLTGAMLGEILQNWSLYLAPCRAILQVTIVIAVQLLLGTMPMLDNFAHFFGFCMGFLCSLAVLIVKRLAHSDRDVRSRCYHRLCQALAVVGILAFLSFGLFAAFGPMDAEELCPWCHMITCIPFPWGCDPAVKGSCWGWDCSAVRLAGCAASAEWTGSTRNGTAIVRCPNGLQGTIDVNVWPVDVTAWDQPVVMSLCKEYCTGY